MVPCKEVTVLSGRQSWWHWVLTGLSSLALALSAYLGLHHLSSGAAIGCGSPDAPGCDQVLGSRWSSVGGVLPVSGLASGTYLAMLVASLSIGPATKQEVRRLAWRAMLVLAGAAGGSAVWFIIVQKWILGAFCPYCMATHITGLLLAALVIWRAPRQFDDDSNNSGWTDSPSPAHITPGATPASIKTVFPMSPRRVVGFLPSIGLALVGVASACILAICQTVLSPSAAYRSGESQKNAAAIDLHSAPLLGPPGAPYVVNLLFDYKCPHCQRLHFLLTEAIRRYGGKLAFALCPTPLNRQCNPYITRDADEFKDSCELAKVGLAVWRANREAFAAFDHWMFSFESGDGWQPKSLEQARAKAVELVGRANFDSALANHWIDRYLQTSIRIYGETGSNAIPKLVFGSRWVTPEAHDTDELVWILQNSLAVPTP